MSVVDDDDDDAAGALSPRTICNALTSCVWEGERRKSETRRWDLVGGMYSGISVLLHLLPLYPSATSR